MHFLNKVKKTRYTYLQEMLGFRQRAILDDLNGVEALAILAQRSEIASQKNSLLNK